MDQWSLFNLRRLCSVVEYESPARKQCQKTEIVKKTLPLLGALTKPLKFQVEDVMELKPDCEAQS